MLTFLVSTIANASNFNEDTGDYRPQYSFSYELFKELLPFPEDFFQIKTLFDTQRILASKLDKEYFQPELLPTWNSTLKKIYEKNKLYENQGIFIYPSRFDVYGINKNDTFTISAFIYAHPGVSTYQGTETYLKYNESLVNATIITNNTYVLGPTQPVFSPLWMQVIEIKVKILDDRKNTTIKIKERNPPDEFNEKYKEIYGEKNYSACVSLLSEEIDRCRIHIHRKEIPKEKPEESNFMSFIVNTILPGFLIFIIAVFIVLFLRLKYDKAKREREKQ